MEERPSPGGCHSEPQRRISVEERLYPRRASLAEDVILSRSEESLWRLDSTELSPENTPYLVPSG